jgi:uncharacterized membrane protein
MYLVLKALHVCAVVAWLGGMVLSSVTLAASNAARVGGFGLPHASLLVVRRWDRFVTAPAIVMAWVLGLTVAVKGGWYHTGWFTTKLLVALGLSAVHGMLSGSLRRVATNPSVYEPKSRDKYLPLLVLLGAWSAIALVIIKPF